MSTYVNVTKEEMEDHLLKQGFKALTLDGTIELVYGKRVDSDGLMLSLRIYTGINPDGKSREIGEDAIRVVIAWKADSGVKIIGGSKRVYRVKGWRNNLQNRIDTWKDQLGPTCEKCKSPMVKRKSKTGQFLGCISFPTCRFTKNIVKVA